MADNRIGRIIGKTSTNSFQFAVNGEIRKWDYVKIVHPEVGPIIAQVTEIERNNSNTIADCMLIGYRNERGFLRLPRTPLEPDSSVFLPEDELIARTLGLQNSGLYLGLLEGKSSIKTFVDTEKLLTKHLAIMAKSGGGKSYAVGVLIEELADKNFPILIIDPHGEYSSLKFKNTHPEDEKYFDMYDIKPKEYKSQVKDYTLNTEINVNSEQLKLSIPNSSFEFVNSVPFALSNAQKGLLYSAVNEVKELKANFDFDDIISHLELTETNAKWGLISAIESLSKSKLFSQEPTQITDLVKPGQVTIINLKGCQPELQEIAVASLAVKLFECRKTENIPPFFFVIEEAHSFCPERGFGESRASKIIRSIASEGRKFGLGLCVISQRPARIDKSVLSQCTSQIVLQVTNPNDLKAISSSFEGISAETENEIRSLPVGKALLIGASDYPAFIDIRIRKSAHGGRAKKIELDDKLEENSFAAPQQNTAQLTYVFRPRLSKKEIAMIEEKEIQEIRMILNPVLCINAKKEKEFYIVADMMKQRVFFLDSKLHTINIPSVLSRLSPMQKKVINAVAISGKSTPAEVMLKTELTFGEAEGIITSLVNQDVLELDGKAIALPANLRAFCSLEKLNFIEKAEYIDITGDKLNPTVKEEDILKLLKETGVEVTNKRQGWIPFLEVKGKDFKKTADALTWSLEL